MKGAGAGPRATRGRGVVRRESGAGCLEPCLAYFDIRCGFIQSALGDGVACHQALQAFQALCRTEGIIPALESSHAVAWLRAYDLVTPRAASFLNAWAQAHDPFAEAGREAVTVEIGRAHV